MAVTPEEIQYFESVFSADGVDSLGGAITANQLTGVLNELWDNVSGLEAQSGITEYRCLYVQNTNATDTLQTAEVYIAADTVEPDSQISIALDPAGVNGEAQTVANETTEPSGVVWQSGEGIGNAIAIGDIPPLQFQAIWMRRVVDSGAQAALASATITVSGDTEA